MNHGLNSILNFSNVKHLISIMRHSQANLVYLSQQDGDIGRLMTNRVAFVYSKLWRKCMLA